MQAPKLEAFQAIELQSFQELWRWIEDLLSLWGLVKALKDILSYVSELVATIQSYALARIFLSQLIVDSLFYIASKSEEEKRQHMDSVSQTLNKIGEQDFIKDEKFWDEITHMKSTVLVFGPKLEANSNKIRFVEEERFDTYTPAIERAVKLYESHINDLKSLLQRNPITLFKIISEFLFRRNLFYHMLQSISLKDRVL